MTNFSALMRMVGLSELVLMLETDLLRVIIAWLSGATAFALLALACEFAVRLDGRRRFAKTK